MRVIYSSIIILLFTGFCQAQIIQNLEKSPDEIYEKQFVSLITALQRNAWSEWKSGTEVVVEIRRQTTGSPVYLQPDEVYTIVKADKLLTRTQLVKGKSIRQKFNVNNEIGMQKAIIGADKVGTEIVEIDGFRLNSVVNELRETQFPGGTRITKEWVLATTPSILLKYDVNGVGWSIASAHVVKKIAGREFLCLEIKKRMIIYSGGKLNVVTTQYLSPDVPGHLVEQTDEFFEIKNGSANALPKLVVYTKVVEIKNP